MNREIKFRGLRSDGNGWVYGYYSPVNIPILGTLGHCINEGGYKAIDINIESLGQFTGLLDKNGVEIYEWDILRNIKSSKGNYFVKFNVGGYDAVYKGNFTLCLHPVLHDFDGAEVIGNIHQNPELI